MIIDKTRLFTLLRADTAAKRAGTRLPFEQGYALWQELTPYMEAEIVHVTAEQIREMGETDD